MRATFRLLLVLACAPGCSSGADPGVAAEDAALDGADTGAARGDATPDAPSDAAPDTTPDVVSDATDAADAGPALDPDGVLMLHPTKKGGQTFRLGALDPNTAPDFEIERGTKATKATEGKLTYWNVLSHALDYASGGSGWTSRLHVYHSKTKTQLYTWKTQKGWLATPADLHDQEVTIYLRGHGALDAPRLAFTLKIRGGHHTASNPDQGSCTMMLFAGAATSGVARFGKELVHPQYDYVKLAPALPDVLTDGKWYGLKLVSYQLDAKQIRYELWLDSDPWDAAGQPRNGWKRLSEYVDVDGKDTGKYTALASWGGLLTTVRTDGWHDVDFTRYSVREIAP